MQMTDEQRQEAYRKYAEAHDMKMDDMSDEDKSKAESAFQQSMDADGDDDMPEEKSLMKKMLTRMDQLISSVTPKQEKETRFSAFKSFGDYWYGEWTNNLKDRDGEWFSRKSILNYEKRVDMGLTPLPELWVWHGINGKSIKIGQAKMIATVERDGVIIVQAVGTYDDTPHAQAAKKYYNNTKKAQAMSHGYHYPEEALKQRVYDEFNTFELTVLPPEAASNPYTSFENIKEAKMNDKKRKYFEEVFGKDIAANLIAEAENKASKMSEFAEFKDFADITGLEHEASSGEKGNESDTDTTGIKALLADLIGDSAEIAEGQLNAGKAITALKARLDKQDARIKALEDELAGTPEPASQSDATTVKDSDLENEAKGKEAGEKSGFWAPFTEEA